MISAIDLRDKADKLARADTRLSLNLPKQNEEFGRQAATLAVGWQVKDRHYLQYHTGSIHPN